MKIVFATNNQHKLNEVRALLPKLEIVGLKDIGCLEDILETAKSLEGNAKIKADYVTQKYGFSCFADDTGLEVRALNNAPGVYSARYAGEPSSSEKNMGKLLSELSGFKDRSAQFKTVIALNLNNKSYLFEGVCKGDILAKRAGNKGFGYDPIFKPLGCKTSFAQMTMEEKGKISHRGKAIEELIFFLNSNNIE